MNMGTTQTTTNEESCQHGPSMKPARELWNGHLYHLWVDCPFCGAQPPEYGERYTPYRARDINRYQEWTYAFCGACLVNMGRLRRIKIRDHYRKDRSRCSGVCLNGKHSCDCRCGGRCHGAGECKCGEAEPRKAVA